MGKIAETDQIMEREENMMSNVEMNDASAEEVQELSEDQKVKLAEERKTEGNAFFMKDEVTSRHWNCIPKPLNCARTMLPTMATDLLHTLD